jgi:hypothetical protein
MACALSGSLRGSLCVPIKSLTVFFMSLQKINLYLFAGLFPVFLLGCQAMNGKHMDMVVPIYATSSEAQAVAVGQFGAVPIELVGESELVIVELVCSRLAAKVRSSSGKVGWVPVMSIRSFCDPAE